MTHLQDLLKSAGFLVTAEITPPRGTDLSPVLCSVEELHPWVDAMVATDHARGRAAMAPIALAHMLMERGIESVLTVTSRDRNRIALQRDLLAAHALSIRTVVCTTGDSSEECEKHNMAPVPVFDLDSVGLLRIVAALRLGKDLAGRELQGSPTFCIGAVVNPGADNAGVELRRAELKVQSGAQFFITQAVFDAGTFISFANAIRYLGVPLLPTIVVLKSGTHARRINATVPGVRIPERLIRELDKSPDSPAKGIEVAADTLRRIATLYRGVHFAVPMNPGVVPNVLTRAGCVS